MIATLFLLAMACAAITVTITRASIFKRVRTAVRQRSPFFGELVACPYCTSHYVALVLVLATTPMGPGLWSWSWSLLVSNVVTIFAVVTLAAPMQWAIVAAHSNLGNP